MDIKATLECPVCHTDNLIVTLHEEYQGEPPMGGVVLFPDSCDCNNGCKLSDEQETEAFYQAECQGDDEPEPDLHREDDFA